MQKYQTGLLSYTMHKNKFKMNQHLNIRTETFIKLREENTTNIFFDTNSSNNFSGISLPIRETKAKINESTSN